MNARVIRAVRFLRPAPLLALAAAALVACSDADTFEPLQPTRVVSFGDSLSDLGSQGGARWTVNGVANNIWVETLAANYGLSISAAAAGGQAYAEGLACVAASGGAAGQPCSTTAVQAQISNFLAVQSFAAKDLVAIQGGANDVLLAVGGFIAGTQTAAARDAAIDAAADALSTEVKRLISAGANQIALTNLPDIGKTPLGAANSSAYIAATRRFNDRLKINLVAQGDKVLLLDLELFFNREIANAGLNRSDAVCGANPVITCNTGNTLAGADISTYVFADTLRPTPAVHQRFGLDAFNQLRNRF